MSNTLHPTTVAAAIADLAAEPVRDAWRYLDRWDALAAAGVPRREARAVMDVTAVQTEPTRLADKWASEGSPGILVMVGKPGTGKTFAATRWVLARHAQRRGCVWISGSRLGLMARSDRDELLRRAETSASLVIDDCGAELTGADWMRSLLSALLVARCAESRPSVIASNTDGKQMAAWMGGRLVDRLRLGGFTLDVESKASLRKAEATGEVDAAGRGRAWYRARRLVDLVGCERVERWADDGTRLPVDLDVGGNLSRHAAREGMGGIRAVRLELEALGLANMSAHAVKVEAEAQRSRASSVIGELAGLDLEAATFEAAAGVVVAEMHKRALAEQERRRKECCQALDDARRSRVDAQAKDKPPPPPTPRAPDWARGKEGQRVLAGMGFAVRPDTLRGGWVLEHGAPAQKSKRPLVDGIPTPGEAWAIAAQHGGPL